MTLTKLLVLALAAGVSGRSGIPSPLGLQGFPGTLGRLGMPAFAVQAGGDPAPAKPKPLGAKQYVDAGATNPKVLLIGGMVEDRILGNVNPWMKARNLNFYWWMIHGIPTRESDAAQMMAGVEFDVIVFNEKGLPAWLKKSVTPEQYEQQARSFIAMLRKNAPKAKLIWDNNLPAIDPEGKLDPAKNAMVVELNRVIEGIAVKEGISLNDFYSLMIDRLDLAKKVDKETQEDRWAYTSYVIPSVSAVNSILKALGKPSLPPYTPGKSYDPNK
ncbi:MAG TPA: SGNH/GDSL hydrolase family protein [Planctomycetota bacterium]|nr:SGNH/GDSL hydrolase family protein [Planctomycetota bacterium]